MPCCLI